MNLIEIFGDNWWTITLALISFGIWLVRLEMKVSRNTEELRRVEKNFIDQRAEDMETRRQEFEGIRSSLREDRATLKEIQEDIKSLIRSGRGG